MRERITHIHSSADTSGANTPVGLESFDPRVMSVERFFPGSHERNMETWSRVASLVSVMHSAVQDARTVGVSERTIASRIQVATLSLNYAVSAFFFDDSTDSAHLTTRKIPDQIISTAAKKNQAAAYVSQWLSDWLLNYTGESRDVHLFLAETIRIERDSREFYLSLVNRFPRPISAKTSAVSYWDRVDNPEGDPNEYIIGIEGYSRDGVKSLRKIVTDFQSFRQKNFHTPLGIGKNYFVTSGSWMYSSQNKIEFLFGESLEQLQSKGFRWSGPVNINAHGSADIQTVSSKGRIIATSVYALLLRDSFLHNYIYAGEYPDVGAFVMPRSTFQNME